MSTAAPLQPSTSDELAPGVVVGSYEIVDRIGAGGMGEVYRARHKAIGRLAAVKVLKAERMRESNAMELFLKEATTLGALSHPNLVEVLDFGHLPNGQPYLTMAFIDGKTLHDVIGDSLEQTGAALPVAMALRITEQVLNALGEAHKKGIVHRDLKPANVMVQREHNGELLVKVLDFGLSRPVDGAILPWATMTSTKASSAAGTPAYVSPEQVKNEDLDGRADLYSLGCTLFEMLAGHAPFVSESPLELVKQQLDVPPPSLRTQVRNVPEEVERLVLWFLQKRRDDRPENADVARTEVRRLLATYGREPGATASPSTLPSLRQLSGDELEVPSDVLRVRQPQRRWLGLGLFTVAVLVGAVALVAVLQKKDTVVQPSLPAAGAAAKPAVPSPLEPVAEVKAPPTPSEVPEPVEVLEELAPVQPTKAVKHRVAPKAPSCTFTDDFKALARRDLVTLQAKAAKAGAPLATLDALEESFGDAMVKRDCRGAERVLDKLRRYAVPK